MDETGISDEELFSMDDLEKDLKKGRGARRLPWLATGLVLGIAGTIFAPRLLAPYLPDSLRGNSELLTGPVLAEEREGDRLLLTIHAEPGAFIASFSERVAEIDLLVNVGDTVSVAVADYDPFIEDPDFEGVRKASGVVSELPAEGGGEADPNREAPEDEIREGDQVPANEGDLEGDDSRQGGEVGEGDVEGDDSRQNGEEREGDDSRSGERASPGVSALQAETLLEGADPRRSV